MLNIHNPLARWVKSELEKRYNPYDDDAKVRNETLTEVLNKMNQIVENQKALLTNDVEDEVVGYFNPSGGYDGNMLI